MGSSLDHVMIVGGRAADWREASPQAWSQLVDRFGERVGAAGGRWLTLRPYGGSASDREWRDLLDDPARSQRWSAWSAGERCMVIVDGTPDGRVGFARAVGSIPGRGEIDEKRVTEALYAPADCEPDLIVILGPHDHLPPSLVWELAYGELVYRDKPFAELDEADIDEAMAEFATRDRRFGGLSPS